MEKFKIKKIKAEFEERWVTVEKIDDGREFKIYFLEFSESNVLPGERSKRRKIGDILEGNLFIAWITEIKRINSELIYIQNCKYSGIEAVVEITEMVNKSTFYAKNNIINREIILKMERDIELNKGDKVFIGGSLQLELEEYKEKLELLEY